MCLVVYIGLMSNPTTTPAGSASRKQALMSTITSADRHTLADLRERAQGSSNQVLAGILQTVLQVESFPHSYTPEAVTLAESVLGSASSGGQNFIANVQSFAKLSLTGSHLK